MSSTRATIFYGIAVRVWTLGRAARAHRTLAAPLLALDVVTLRGRQGTLRSSSPVVDTVPAEVWSLIRDELIDVALEDALESMLAELRCYECKVDGAERAAKLAATGARGGGVQLSLHDWNTWNCAAHVTITHAPTFGTTMSASTRYVSQVSTRGGTAVDDPYAQHSELLRGASERVWPCPHFSTPPAPPRPSTNTLTPALLESFPLVYPSGPTAHLTRQPEKK